MKSNQSNLASSLAPQAHLPPLTTARFVCACHPVFATSGGSVAADIISQFLDEPVSRSLIHRAATLGSVRLLDRLVHQARSNGTDAFLLEHWLTRATKTAAEHGHLEVVRQLLRCSSEHEPSSYRTSCIETAVEGAMAGGQLVVLQEMVAMLDDGHTRALLGTLQVSVLFIDVIEWLEGTQVRVLLDSSIPSNCSDDRALASIQSVVDHGKTRHLGVSNLESDLNLHYVLLSAAAHGYNRLARWLVEERGQGVSDSVVIACCFNTSPSRNELLPYLMQQASNRLLRSALKLVIHQGALEMTELVLAHWPELWLQVIADHRVGHTSGLLHCAAASGSRHMMQWALRYHHDHHRSLNPGLPWESTMIKTAAGLGHLAMVQRLHNHSLADWDGTWPDSADGTAMDRLEDYHGEGCDDECADAIANGHVEVVEWLLAHRPPVGLTVADWWGAVRHGHLALVKILHEKLVDDADGYDPEKASAVHSAATEGHFEVIVYIHTHWSHLFNWTDVLGIKPVDFAIAKWAHANTNAYHNDNANATSVLDDRAPDVKNQVMTLIEYGRFGVFEWLLENGLLVPGSLDSLVDVAKRGDLYSLQWLAVRVPELMDWEVLQEATRRGGPPDVVAWLAGRAQE